MKEIRDTLKVIGIIHSRYKTTEESPRQKGNTISKIEIYEEFKDGLKDLEEFAHAHIYYWLHKSKGYNLITNTPWEKEAHGLFTTRSLRRPNPLGHSIVKIVEIRDNIIHVKDLDAINGTPVIDIKPYIKEMDIKENTVSGWAEKIRFKF
jgi:formylmethanofuran dehydrogenase subunit E